MAISISPRSLALALCAVGAFAGPPAALAQAQAQGAAACDGVQQDRTACLREAGAARQAAQRGGLTSAAPSTYEQNALARCQLQPMGDRAACEARVTGSGNSMVEGSVMGGGVIRETVTPVPAPAPAR